MKKKKWLGTWPAQCDLCQTQLADYSWFADCVIPSTGYRWGLVCPSCYTKEQCQCGTGFGQRYDARTLEKVEG